MRGYPPSFDALHEHHVPKNLSLYFPYLVYYHEPDLCYSVPDVDELYELRLYINELFKENVVIKERDRKEPCRVKESIYDYVLNHNDEACLRFAKKLTPYERGIFLSSHELTLERLKSAEPIAHIGRFYPFLVRLSEPSLSDKQEGKLGIDKDDIVSYIMDILYDHVEYVDD